MKNKRKTKVLLLNSSILLLNSSILFYSELPLTTTIKPIQVKNFEKIMQNEPLIKFISKNGIHVWNKMLQMRAAHSEDVSLPTPMLETEESQDSQDSQDDYDTEYEQEYDDENESEKQLQKVKDQKLQSDLQNFLSPVQIIEEGNEIVDHKVETPNWFKHVISSPNISPVHLIPIFQREPPPFIAPIGIPPPDITDADILHAEIPLEPVEKMKGKKKKKKKSKSKPRQRVTTFDVGTTTKEPQTFSSYITAENIGRFVLNGFTGIVRGIGSFLGFLTNRH